MCVCVCVCVCVRARARVRACVHACARASQRVRASVCVGRRGGGGGYRLKLFVHQKMSTWTTAADSSKGELHERNFPGPEVIRV